MGQLLLTEGLRGRGCGWEWVFMEVSLGDVCGGGGVCGWECGGRVSAECVSGCMRSWESDVTMPSLRGRATPPLLGELWLGQSGAERLKGGRPSQGPRP